MKPGRLIAAIVVATLLALIVWGFVAKRREAGTEAEGEKPVEAPSRVSVRNGQTIVSLDAATQAKSGIAVASLAPASTAGTDSGTVQAFGTVADVQVLLDLQNEYLTERANARKAGADVDATRREYERLRFLNADRKNVSDKAVETARAAYETARSSLEAANVAATVALSKARQRWGEPLAALITSPTGLSRLAAVQDVVIQISIPPDAPGIAASERVVVRAPDGMTTRARLIGSAPRTDPKTQGRSFFYVASSQNGAFPPGMTLDVSLPTPVSAMVARGEGVFVPNSAVVWSGGATFVYVEVQSGQFRRAAVSLKLPAPGGWIVTSGVAAGTRVVVTGAQELLSEEFRSQIKVSD